jgi:hypothetical protein
MKKMSKFAFALVAMIGLVAGLSFATTTDLTSGSGFPAYSAKDAQLTVTVDFAATPIAASNDVLEVVSVPANTFVKALAWKMTTVSTAGAELNVGDDLSAERYLSAKVTTNTTLNLSAATAWVVYTAANTIDLKGDGAITNGVGTLTVFLTELP